VKPASKYAVALVTAPDLKTARNLAKAGLESPFDRLRQFDP